MKKGQSAGGAAALIAAMVGLILLYILFLPPDDRAELLGENITSASAVRGIGEDSRTLLKESPGTLVKAKQDEFEHRINSFNLFEKSEDKVLKSFDSIYVESKSGSIKKRTFAMSMDASKTSDAQISFFVSNHNGRLILKVNDAEIYNSEASGQVVIRLDKLQEDNVFEFSTDEVGFQFWRTNFYDLKDIKITGTVKVLENLEAKQVFVVGDDEANNIDKASMIYLVDCRASNVGILRVYVNGVIVASGVPDCGSIARVDIDPSIIIRGSNNIRFVSERGNFLVDQILVRTKLKEPVDAVYFFEVNSTKYSWIANNTFRAVLKMAFVDDGEEKFGQLNINNRLTSFDSSRSANLTKDITPFIVEGNNFIKIIPQRTLHIIGLQVRLE